MYGAVLQAGMFTAQGGSDRFHLLTVGVDYVHASSQQRSLMFVQRFS
jgi:hypothetical protein